MSPLVSTMARNGRYVVFRTVATNLLSTPDPSFYADLYLRDLVTDTTELVSVAADGGFPTGDTGSGQPAISDDGRYVFFNTAAKDMLPPGGQTDGDQDMIIRDRCVTNGATVVGCTPHNILVSPDAVGTSPSVTYVAMSGDGQWVAWTNGILGDVRAWNHVTGETRVIDTAFDGGPADSGSSPFVGGMSYDGRYVLFAAHWDFLLGQSVGHSEVYFRDRLQGTTDPVSVTSAGIVGDTDSWATSISTERPHGSASFDRSAGLIRRSSSRECGPITPIVAMPADASNTAAARPSAARPNIASVFWWAAVGVITQNRSAASRVTVPSSSIPPRAFSISV